ncbi:MAG: ribonuclease III [Deltaproteobacteria bacterium]|nr:ribonuclease III [Deltaproteobacteria bacterium]
MLMDRLGYHFSDISLLRRGLTHRSYANEANAGDQHNERLEFLGDAVVGLCVGAYLMERYPDAREGELTKLRAMVVSGTGLSRAARTMGLGEYLRLGRGEEQGGGRDKASILSDAFEAIIGAIFIEAGFDTVRRVVIEQLRSLIDAAQRGELDRDYKTHLQERLVAQGAPEVPRYVVVDERGPDHDKTFEVAVWIGGSPRAQASGHSKKQAEQRAASLALESLDA